MAQVAQSSQTDHVPPTDLKITLAGTNFHHISALSPDYNYREKQLDVPGQTSYILTRIPMDFDNYYGTTECLIRRTEMVSFEMAARYTPAPAPTNPFDLPYTTKQSQKGLFASRTLEAGELILAERPLLIVVEEAPPIPVAVFEQLMSLLYEHMNVGNQTEFRRLSGGEQEQDTARKLCQKLGRNSYFRFTHPGTDGKENIYRALASGRVLSNMNHKFRDCG